MLQMPAFCCCTRAEWLQLENHDTHLFVSVEFTEWQEVNGRQLQNILSLWLGLVKRLVSRWATIFSCWYWCGGKATPFYSGGNTVLHMNSSGICLNFLRKCRALSLLPVKVTRLNIEREAFFCILFSPQFYPWQISMISFCWLTQRAE